MTASGSDAASRRARAVHCDEETRYRAVAELDAADARDRAVLVERLADPSWRVRSAAADRIAQRSGPDAIRELVQVLAEGPGVGAREAAAAALARIGAPAMAALVERLAGEDPDLRQAAAGVLAEIADGRAVPPLTARLADGDPNVRAAAADALGKIGGPAAIAALEAAVDSDDATLRLSAIEALATLRACLPTERIVRLLTDRSLRRALYRMLGASEDAAALAVVGRGAGDASRPAREAALGALGHQRARRGISELGPALMELRAASVRDPGLGDAAWTAALGSEEPFVAVGALTALAAAGTVRHAGRMVRLAEDERHRPFVEESLEWLPGEPELRAALADALPSLGPHARITALGALMRLGSAAALEALVREASDGESDVQSEAIAALGRLRDARAVAALAGLLAAEGPAAALAATALVRIGQSGAEERAAVLGAVRPRSEASPCAALYRTLGALGGPEDVNFVVAGLRAVGAAERAGAAGAARALAERGLLDAGVASHLVAALADPAWTVRASAARAIAEMARKRPPQGGAVEPDPGPEPSGALLRALRDPEHAVRAAAAEALGARGRSEDADSIAELAQDPDSPPMVIVAALHALAALGSVRTAALSRAVRHEDAEVVKEAVAGAARVAGPEGERILLEAAASTRWDVRRAAARAMAQRNDRGLRADAERLAASDPDPLVARAFAEAARALGGR